MEEGQKPTDCQHYLHCKYLDVLFQDSDQLEYNIVVFPRDAEPICRQCQSFESRNGG